MTKTTKINHLLAAYGDKVGTRGGDELIDLYL